MHIEDIDSLVWETILKAIDDSEVLVEHIPHLSKRLSRSPDDLRKGIREHERALTRLEGKRSRLIDLCAEGLLPRELFKRKSAAIDDEEENTRGRITDLTDTLDQVIDRPAIVKEIRAFCSIASRRLRATLAQTERRDFLWNLLNVIVLDSTRGRMRIVGNVPIGNIATYASPETDGGPMSTSSRDHGQCPTLRFEIEAVVPSP